MFETLLSSIGPEIPLTLALLALLGIRQSVTPRASLRINASPDRVFEVIDVYDGKTDNWGSTSVRADLVDPATRTFKKSYMTTLSNGVVKTTTALFRMTERHAARRLVLQRAGLEGRSTSNELLQQTFDVVPHGDGAQLSIAYAWGSRPLLAQLTARADLWGGIYRLKGLAETGRPDERPHFWISIGMAAVTGLMSLFAFGLMLGWIAAIVVVFALFVHEFGHLLAYRLVGQPWGRMVFLPFLGAIALPRLAFESQSQSVFAALMGPGFSFLLALACLAAAMLGDAPSALVAVLGLITVGLNIFNLLPVEPLDGGFALRSVLSRLMGRRARFGLMAVGALIAVVGLFLQQIILIIFGGIAILANLKERTIDHGLEPLSRLQIAITVFAYVALTTAYITLLKYFLGYAAHLQSAA
jgi:Zn-dependent protease